MWLMEQGGKPDNYIAEYIQEIRGIINLCTRVMEGEMHKSLLPGRRTKKKRKMDMNKTHASYMKQMKANNNMNNTYNAHDHARKKKFTTTHGAHKSMETTQPESIGILHGKRNK